MEALTSAVVFKGSRVKQIPNLIAFASFAAFFAIPLYAVIYAVSKGSPLGASWIGFVLFLAPFTFFVGLTFYTLSIIISPPTLTLTKQDLIFRSSVGENSLRWEDCGPVSFENRSSGRQMTMHYARFPRKDRGKDFRLILDGYTHDYRDVSTRVEAAQSGRLIDPGYAPTPTETIFVRIPIVLIGTGIMWSSLSRFVR